MDNLEKLLDEKKKNSRLKRPKYGMRKLSVGLVSCVVGYVVFASPKVVSAQGVLKEDKPVIETEAVGINSRSPLEEILSANPNGEKSLKIDDLFSIEKIDKNAKELEKKIEEKEAKEEKLEASEEVAPASVRSNTEETPATENAEVKPSEAVTEEKPAEATATEEKVVEKPSETTEAESTANTEDKETDKLKDKKLESDKEKVTEAVNAADNTESTEPTSTEEKPTKEYKESYILKDEKVITDGKGYRQSEIAGAGRQIKVTDENLGEEKEGVRVETLQPSPDSKDKKAFGVEVNIDKTKSDRTYNGFMITDSGRNKDINPNKSEFLKPGEILPTNKEDPVTYQPDVNDLTYEKRRQSTFNYSSTEADRKHLANKDTGKTTLAWKGEYDKDNPNGKFLTGSNFEVSVGVNPYPNENKDLSLIELGGNTTISKVPVKNQYIVSEAKIVNAGDEDYTRLVGEVYHPDEDILVNGAQALIVNASNIGELKTATGNQNLAIGQIVFKMPQGALQDKNSIFNDDKFKGVQNLRAKFFARPRTKEEFTKLAQPLDEFGAFNYESTGAGTSEITHNGKKVTIDKQGIARYDHYNLVGEMTINLDDTKNYDQTFNRIQNKDDTAYSNTVTPGGSINLKVNSPSGKEGDPSKSYEDMQNAKTNGLADGKIVEEFKKQAEEKGWKVETKEGNPSEFTVTAPKDARPGDTMYLPIEYKYTNGSKDYHSFYFVVKETNNVKPEYHAEVGFQGDTLTNTPDITLSDKPDINNPASYELVPGEYKDDKGNAWSNVSIDKDTGVVTAVVPDGEGVTIIGGENVYIPVKVNYVDKLTKQPKEEIVKAQFIARPKYKATVVDTDEKEIPFASKEEFDETLPLGEIKVINPGKAGKEKTVFEQDVVNGKKGLIDPETGKFTEGENLFRKVTTTIEEKEDRLVKVGVKPVEETVEIPRTVEVEVDPTMEPTAEPVVTEEGNDGVVTIKTTRDPQTGAISITKETTTEAKPKKVKVGTKTTGTVIDEDKIPFGVKVEKDPSLKKGEWNYKKDENGEDISGKVGTNKKTWTIVNSKVVGDPVVEETKPEDAVILVGDENFTGNVTHDVEEKIPFKVQVIEDPTMDKGKTEVVQTGVEGTKTTTYTQAIENGEAKGDMTSTVKSTTEAKDHIIKVGTKPLTGSANVETKNQKPFDVEIEYDNTKPAGTVEIVEGTGVPGEETKTTPVTSEDGKVTPGETTTNEDKAPINKKIIVGTQGYNGEFKHEYTNIIPFETEVEIDPTLAPNEVQEVQKGVNGETKTTVTQTITNGVAGDKQVSDPVKTKDPVNRKIKVGAKTEGKHSYTEELPFEYEVKVNPEREAGTYEIIKKGKVGSKTTEWTITNSVAGEGKVTAETPAENAVIEVGNKDFTGTITHDVTEEIPFTVKIVEDPTMDKGKSEVQQQGVAGSKTTTYTQNIKNGTADGELTSSVDESKTVQPVEHIIKVGTKPLTGSTTVTSKNEKPFEVEIVYDNTKPIGFVEEKGGVVGEETNTTEVKAEDGSVTAGETSTKEDKAPVKKTITVGTKDYTGEFTHEYTNTIPFETEVTIDPSLKPNEIVEDQKGINGVTKTTVTQSFTNGTLGEKKVSEPTEVTKVQNRKIRIGSMTEGKHSYTEELPFNYEVKVNPEREAGTYEIIKPGKVGSKTTEWTITNSVVGEGKVTAETPAENAVIEVGNKDFTGEVTHTDKKEIPFEVEIVENPNLLVGTKNVKQQGEAGEKEVTYTQAIKNGQAEGDVTTTEKETKAPKKHIIEVGTKPVEGNTHELNENVNVEIEYVYDNTLNKGEVKKGDLIPGKVTSKIVNKIENGKVVTTEEKTVTPAKQIIKVGSKDYTGTFEYVDKEIIPFETEYKIDPTLEPGEEVVEKEGKLGEKETNIIQNFTNGEMGELVKGKTRIIQNAENRIVRIGAKTDGKIEKIVDIGYKTNIIYDDNMLSGESEIVQEGMNGKKKLTISVVNSK